MNLEFVTRWIALTTIVLVVVVSTTPCSATMWLVQEQEQEQEQEKKEEQETDKSEPEKGQAMSVDLFDDFDGAFEIDWEVLRPDKEMVSLETNPGQLTITTQRGSINGNPEEDELSEGNLPKNFHLVTNPLAPDIDYQVEVKISDFHPSAYYHQCGIILYNDDDNYVKLSFEYHRPHPSGLSVTWGMEVDQESTFQGADPGETSELILRLVCRDGKLYGYAGKSVEELELMFDAKEWNVDSGPQKVGLYAKNGGNRAADPIEIQFDYFRFTSVVDD